MRAIRHADMTVKAGHRARAGRRERRRQVHSHQDHRRRGVRRHRRRSSSRAPRSRSAPPLEAINLGIATVYQEPQLFAELTVSENIFTGREISTGGRIDWRAQNAKVVELLELIGLPGRYATAVVGTLSIAEQQQVSIAKALAGNAKMLILDEPSAILTDAEIEVLFTRGAPADLVRRRPSSTSRTDSTSCSASPTRSPSCVTARPWAPTPSSELSVRQIVELMVGGILNDERAPRVDRPTRRPSSNCPDSASPASSTT